MVGIRRVYGGKRSLVSRGWAVEEIAHSTQQFSIQPLNRLPMHKKLFMPATPWIWVEAQKAAKVSEKARGLNAKC